MGFRNNEDGLTLVELIVTLLISSIVLVILGAIIVSANVWWIRSRVQMESMDEMRYAERRMGYLLRNAAYASVSPYRAFEVSGAGKRLDFNNGTSSIEWKRGQLIHTNGAGESEVLLNDVVSADMYVLQISHMHKLNYRYWNCLSATLVTEKNAPNGEIIRSSTTCLYKSRNSGL